MIGRIHSIESMGLVDGPGIRSIVFLQGCALRCLFCHNPDTWDTTIGLTISPEDLLTRVLKFKTYFDKSNGGVTFSGGEPLLQPDFLIDCLKLCKEQGINTAIDTAGYGLGKYDEVLKYTDLVILDIKHINKEGYKFITGGGHINRFDEFLDSCIKNKSKLWLRQVIVPTINDNEEYIRNLANYILDIKSKCNVEKVELLPYHTLGEYKYESLNLQYKLNGVPNLSNEKLKELQDILYSIIE